MSQEGFGKRLVPSLGHALQKGRACQWPASPCPSPACAVTADPGHSQRSEAEKKCIEKIDRALKAEFKKIRDKLRTVRSRIEHVDVPVDVLRRMLESRFNEMGMIAWHRKSARTNQAPPNQVGMNK